MVVRYERETSAEKRQNNRQNASTSEDFCDHIFKFRRVHRSILSRSTAAKHSARRSDISRQHTSEIAARYSGQLRIATRSNHEGHQLGLCGCSNLQ
jgi:hypothetical protein